MGMKMCGRLGQKQFGATLGAICAAAMCSVEVAAQVTINSSNSPLTASNNLEIDPGNALGTVTFDNDGVVPTLIITGSFSTDRAMVLSDTGAIEVDLGKTLTANGSISGGGALLAGGQGTLVLNGVNSYGGDTRITGGGVVQVSAANNLGDANNDIMFTGSGGTLQVTGAGFITDRTVQMHRDGTISVDAGGTLELSGSIQLSPLGNGVLTVAGEGQLVLSGANSFSTGTVFTGAQLTVSNIDGGQNLGHGGLTFAGAGAGAPVLNITGTTASDSSLDITLTSNGAINVSAGETATLNGDVTGAGQLQVVGLGTLVLGDTTNNYSGGTMIQSGTLQVSAGGSLGTGAVDFAAGGSGVLALGGGADVTVTNGITLTGNGTISTTAPQATLSGIVTGAGALAIDGGGTTVLSNALNDFSGGVEIINGTLSVTAAGALGAVAGGVEFNAGVGQTATLEVGHGINILQAITLNSAGTIDVSAGATATISGQITGGAAQTLTIDGAGAVILTNVANELSFLGGVSIEDGSLSVASGLALGAGAIEFNATGVLPVTLAVTDTTTVGNALTFTTAGSVTVSAGETSTFSGVITSGAGDLLTLNGPGTTIISNVANNLVGGVAIQSGTLQIASLGALAGASSITLSSGGTLNLSAQVAVAGGLTLNVAAGQTGTLSGAGLTGVGGLTLDGGGTLVLSGANGGLAGGTVLHDGTLSIADPSALAAGSVTFDGVGGAVPTLEMTATMTVANDIVLLTNGELSATVGVTATMTGQVTGAGGLVIGGAGTVVLDNAANSFVGGVTVESGTLQVSSLGALGAASAVNFTGAGTLSTSGVVAIGVAQALNVSTAPGQTGTLSGAGFSGNGTLTIGGGGTVNLAVASNTVNMSITNGTLSAGTAAALGSGVIGFDAVGATLNLTDTMTVANNLQLNSDGVVSTASGEVTTINGAVGGAAGNTLELIGGGTTVLTNATNTFVGGVVITDGTLQVSADGQLGVGGAVDLNAGVGDRATLAVDTTVAFSTARDIISSGAETGQIEVLGNGSATFSGAISGAGALDISGSGDAVLSGLNSLTGAMSVSSTGDVTISGQIAAASSLTITGSGTTTLSAAANNFAGNVTISAGTLAVNADAQLGLAANDIVFSAATGAGTLQIDGTVPFVTARDIELGLLDAGDGRIIVTGSATVNGLITGVNDLVKSGTGTLTLTQDNSAFTGGFTITAGVLEVTQVNALGGAAQGVTFAGPGSELRFTIGAFAVTSGEDFLLQDNGTISSDATSLTLAGDISASGTAALTLSGTSDYVLEGAITGPIGLNLNAGTVTFAMGAGVTSTISGPLTGSGFNLQSAGTLVLSGANTFAGNVRILGGTLDLRSAGALGAAGNDIEFIASGTVNFGVTLTTGSDISLGALADGTINAEGGVTATLNGVISGAGDLKLGGTGTVVLGGVNTLTGSVVIDRVTAQAAAASAFGAPSSIEVTNGGTLSATNTFTLAAPVSVTGTGGTISIASGKTLTIGAGLSGGATPLTVSGAGTLLLNGDSSAFTGAMTIGNTATLDLSATAIYGGDITVGAGTTLDGTGTILGGVTVNTGGTIAPGNSAGTITMDSLTVAANGNMEFEIEGVGATQADRIVLTNAGVAATIAATANLTITQSAFIPTATMRQFLDATNGGALTIGAVDVLVRLVPTGGTAQPVLSIQTWSFNETNGQITTTRAADAFQDAVTFFGGTSEQISSGAAVDVMAAAADSDPTGSTAAFVYSIQSQAVDGPTLLALVSGLSPNDYGVVSQVPLQSMRFFGRSQMEYNDSRRRAYGMAQYWASQQASRVASASDAAVVAGLAAGQAALADPSAGGRRVNVYGRMLGGATNYDGDASLSGYDQNTWQATFGMDYVVESGFLIGLAGGYSSDNADMTDGSSADANSIVFDPYAVWGEDEGFFAELHGYAAVSFWDTTRLVAATSSTASGNFTGWSAGVMARGGYDWYLNDEFRITPELSLFCLYTQAPSFTETGAGVANLNVASRSQSNALIQIGPEFGWDYELTRGRYVSLGFSFGYEYLFGDQSDVVASFASGSSQFSTAISSPDRSRLFIGLSCDLPLADSWDLRFEYEGMFSADTSANGGSAMFSYHF